MITSGEPSSSTGPRFRGGRPRIPNALGFEAAGFEEDLDVVFRAELPALLQKRHLQTSSSPSYRIRYSK